MRIAFLCFMFILQGTYSSAQELENQELSLFRLQEKALLMDLNQNHSPLPLFSIELNHKIYNNPEEIHEFLNSHNVRLEIQNIFRDANEIKLSLKFSNRGTDSVWISNIIPFGGNKNHYYISGEALKDTSRSVLHLPNQDPIGVIVPHNNNDLSFTAFSLDSLHSVYGLICRDNDSIQNYLLIRNARLLLPGESIGFFLYAGTVEGDWQDAMRYVFQKKKLFEIENFDTRLYDRADLSYIRKAYTMHLMMAWEKSYFNRSNNEYTLEEFLLDKIHLYGGDDIFTIWPTWPVLGLDQRDQWQMMEELPGGLGQQKILTAQAHALNTKYFISYNPWDDKDEVKSLSKLGAIIKQIDADGVVLDTRAEASKILQNAVDKAKAGVVLYSEGMATPRDMQGIISGRVHNDIFYPPLLNLNKLIKPDFAIFRVVEVNKEHIKREYSLSLFNGHGVEINVMRPGRQSWMEEEYKYWGRCVRILKENSANFNSPAWTPLIKSLEPDIYVNQWPLDYKVLYTVFSLRPEGFQGPLFKLENRNGYHLIDLWNHSEVKAQSIAGFDYANIETESFNAKWLNGNNEGVVTVIAQLPVLIKTALQGDLLTIKVSEGNNLKIWSGNPSYDNTPINSSAKDSSFHLFQAFGRVQGKFVIQLFDGEELLDEQILFIPPGTPLLVSETKKTKKEKPTTEMAYIPSGKFTMNVVNGDEFIGYPKEGYPRELEMSGFYMDKYPVTNAQFKLFLELQKYQPTDPTNFLKHWSNGTAKAGEENFPVTYVSYEDAQAYAEWAGKRLPTEAEWQWAAQTNDNRLWPWGNETKKRAAKSKSVSTTYTLIDYGTPDSSYCNLGNGQLYPVGKYTKGANPHGLYDLVGSVWQLTNDLYQSDSYEYVILKGGSYFHPGGSWWYAQGGPKPLHYRQMLLSVSQGFERNATVGFRCAKD